MKKTILMIFISVTIFAGMLLFNSNEAFADAPTIVLNDGQDTPLETDVVYPAGTTVKAINFGTFGGGIYLDGSLVVTMLSSGATYTVGVPFTVDSVGGDVWVAFLNISTYIVDEPYNYDIEESLESYPDSEPATAYVNEGTALSNAMMKALLNNPGLSLEFSFEYEGVKHVVFIPAGKAVNDDIPWYGPAWLLKHYGEKTDAPRTYEVKKGDTLNKIAKALETTTDALMKLNPQIKNKNKIYPGQKINY